MAIKEYRLGDICKIQRGSSPRPIHNFETKKVTKYPWAKISDLKENEIFKTENYLTNIDDFKWKKYMICEPGDLLLTCCATPGIPFINLVKNCGYHDGFLKITPNENSIIKKYLIYKIIKDRNKLIKNGNGTIFINLNKSIVENFKILTPSIYEQKEIINIIEPFEKLIEQTNKKINNVDLIFQNIIENIKTKSKIVDLASINAGQSPPQISKYWKNGKIPFVNINDLTNNMYVLFSKNFINDLAYNDYRCKLTTNFSILVGKVSPSKNKISVIDNGFIVNGAIRILEPLDKNAYGQLFESIRNKAYILSKIACGSVQQQINSLQLSNLEINFDLSMNEIFNIQLNYKKVLLKSLNVIQKIISSLIELNII